MDQCWVCGFALHAEGGRWDRKAEASSDENERRKVRYCIPCWNAKEYREMRQRLEAGPRAVQVGNTVGYELGRPWENPLGYLITYGIVDNPWASWMARMGLLDDHFDRPVCDQDFGDADSRQLAVQLGVDIDGRRYAR